MNQRKMDEPVLLRVRNRNAGFTERYALRMANFVALSVRQSQHKRLERLAIDPFSDGFHVHACQFNPAKPPPSIFGVERPCQAQPMPITQPMGIRGGERNKKPLPGMAAPGRGLSFQLGSRAERRSGRNGFGGPLIA
jgi:hypothetical protein